MALALVNLKFGVNVQEFTSQLDQVNKSAQKMGKQMQAIGKNMSMYVTAPLVALAGLSVKMASDFDDSMRKVQATSNASAADFDLLKKKAMEMGASTKFTAAQSAEAMNYMAMAGWKTTDIMEGLSGVMKGAAASGEDLGLVADIVTDGLSAFGLTAKDSNAFVDILAATASNANTNIKKMGDSFRYAAPVAGSLGFTVGDTALAIGLMANSGIKAEQAGTAMRAIFTRLVKPTKESEQAMTALGITVANADGTMRPLKDVLTELRAKFAALTPEQKAMYAGMLAGTEGMSGLLSITGSSTEAFDKLSHSIENSAGTADRMADTMEGGMGGAMRALNSAVEGLMIQFGDIMAPMVTEIAVLLKGLANWFSQLSVTTKQWMVGIGALVAAIGPLLIGLGTMTMVVIPALKAGLLAITMLWTPLTAKILIAVAVIGVLAAAAKVIYDSWGTITEFFGQLWDKVKLIFISGIKSLLETVNQFTSKIGLDFQSTIDKLSFSQVYLETKKLMTPAVKVGDVFNAMGESVMNTFTGVKKSIGDARNAITDLLAGGETKDEDGGGGGGGGSTKLNRISDSGISAPSMGVPPAMLALPKTIAGIAKELPNQLNPMKATIESFNADINGLLAGSIANTFGDIGTAIGGALANGGNVLAAAGGAILKNLAGFLGSLGKMMIEYGTMAIIKAKLDASIAVPGAGFVTGPLAIAAGVALLAISAAIGGKASGKGSGVSSGGGDLGAPSSVPRRAGGGLVQNGHQYMVGERGPEMFTAGMTGTITPNHMMNKGGGMGGGTVHITGRLVGNGRDLEAIFDERVRIKGRTT